jgi:hypothetical protein
MMLFSETLMYSDTLDPLPIEEDEDHITASSYDDDELSRTTAQVDKPFIEGRTNIQSSDISEVFLPQENKESADGSNCDSNHLPLAALPIFWPSTWLFSVVSFVHFGGNLISSSIFLRKIILYYKGKVAYQPKHNSQTSENLKSGLTEQEMAE